jgi:uncharacterized damage-inducible protein DinB
MKYTPKQADFLRTQLAADLAGEYQILAKIVGAVPTDKLGWKPTDEKSKPFGEVAGHAGGAGRFFTTLLDGAQPTEPNYQFKTKAALAKALKGYEKEFQDKLAAYSAKDLAKEIDFFGQKHPAITLLRWHLVHLVHHRAQLGMYLRVMGAKVPSTYGGSADDSGM